MVLNPAPAPFALDIAGRTLHAEWLHPAGAAPGPVLVFLHEGLGSIAQWKDFPAGLCVRLGLPGFVYERQGFGRSAPLDGPRTPRYLHAEAVEVLPAVLAAAGIADYVLIGHSDGGSIALLHAAAFPSGPRALVTEAAHVRVEDITLAGIRNAVHAWESTDLPAKLARYHGDKTAATFAGWSDIWLSESFREWDIVAELPAIRCPVMALQGADDEYGTPKQLAWIAGAVSGPVDTLLIPKCAHVPHFQARQTVMNALTEFVRRHA